MRGPRRGELRGKLVAQRRQGGQVQPGRGDLLEVEEVVHPVVVLERPVGRVAPAVGLAREELDPRHAGGLVHKGREISRQRVERDFVDHGVTRMVPGQGRERK